MLKEKRDRDAALPSERAIPKKKKKLATHTYMEERCDNHRGCCYILKSTNQHHKMTTTEQAQWAQAVANNLGRGNSQLTTHDLITKYEDG
jgi:hypothetical protein